MKLSLALLLALFPLATASAQSVTLRGQVATVVGTAGYVVDCTGVAVSSTLFDLGLLVGQQAELGGNWNGSVGAPAIVVTAVQAVTKSFEITGPPKIGKIVHPTVTAAPGSVAFAFVAVTNAFLPLGAAGTGLLGGVIVPTGSGTVGGTGVLQLNLTIPNDPILIGVDMFGQAVVVDPILAAFWFTNPDCHEIKA